VDPTQLVGPAALFLLMGVVGLMLTPADFRRVAEAPRAVIGGTLAQLALLPLMTLAVVWLLGLPPVFGARAVQVAISPGAGVSNILTALARANTALSVTLTAVASLLSVLTIPVIGAIALRAFHGQVEVEVPVVPLLAQLSVSLVLPIGLGMWVRARWPDFARRNARVVQRAAFAGIALLVTLAIAFGEEVELGVRDVELGLLGAAVWTLGAMALGWGVGAVLRLPSDDRFTLLIEFGARNVTVATIIAISALQRIDLGLFSAAYFAVGYPACALAVAWRRRLRRPGAPPTAAPPVGRNGRG
jgi:BASS family bile acid:Na+ symporter